MRIIPKTKFGIISIALGFTVVLVCVGFGCYLAHAQRQSSVINRLERAGAIVQYDFQWDSRKNQFDMTKTPPGATWLRWAFGEYFFSTPIRVIAVGEDLSDVDMKDIGTLELLEDLQLSGTCVSDAGLRHISELRHINNLTLGKTKVTDQGMGIVSGMKSLEHLTINNTEISDVGMQYLHTLPNLHTLNISGTKVTSKEIQLLKQTKPSIIVITTEYGLNWPQDSCEPGALSPKREQDIPEFGFTRDGQKQWTLN